MNAGFYFVVVLITVAPLVILDWRFDDKMELLMDQDENIIFAYLGVVAFWIIGFSLLNRRY